MWKAQKLHSNPKKVYQNKLKSYVKKGKAVGILNTKEAIYLLPDAARTP